MRALIFEAMMDHGALDGSFPFSYSPEVSKLLKDHMHEDITQWDGRSTEEVGRQARQLMLSICEKAPTNTAYTKHTIGLGAYLMFEIYLMCTVSPGATFKISEVAWWYPNP